MTFADRLRTCMEAPRKVTQQELASACNMTQATVSRLLRGQDPSGIDLYRISQFFSVPMEWLLFGDIPDENKVKVAETVVEYQTFNTLTQESMEKIYEALKVATEEIEEMKQNLKQKSKDGK